MTSSRRHSGRHHARTERPEPLKADVHYCTQVAWARDRTCIPEAKQQSHDLLIEGMGRRRTGGVSWRIAHGPDATVAVELMRDGSMSPEAEHYDEIAKLLSRYGGFLVIALAAGTP